MARPSSKITSPRVVYLFGDSQTQFSFGTEGCWGALLADKLQRRCDVINRGFSGYNSRWCAAMLPCVIRPEQARDTFRVVVMLGTNDAMPASNKSLQHVPLTEYEDNMRQMAAYLKGIGIDGHSIILISPPPVDENKWNDHCRANAYDNHSGVLNDELVLYAEASARAAASAEVSYVDLYGEMMKTGTWKSFVEVDGLHLSRKGSEFLLDLLWPLLREDALALPTYFPGFLDIHDNDAVPEAAKRMLGFKSDGGTVDKPVLLT